MLFKGGMLVYEATTGAYIKPTDAAGLVPAGVYAGIQDDALTEQKSVASGEVAILTLERGKIWIAHTGAEQADVGKYHYLVDDGDLTLTASQKTQSVLCVGLKPGYLLIDFRQIRNS